MNVARRGLIVLTLINLFNYIDRYIIAAISESLRHSSLHISDLQYGLLGSGFIIVYMATAPVFGALGDTRSRPRLIALGVTIWSVATAPEARGRGLSTALMRQALSDAAARGCETSTLQATKLGRPVYERVGYQDFGALQMWECRESSER